MLAHNSTLPIYSLCSVQDSVCVSARARARFSCETIIQKWSKSQISFFSPALTPTQHPQRFMLATEQRFARLRAFRTARRQTGSCSGLFPTVARSRCGVMSTLPTTLSACTQSLVHICQQIALPTTQQHGETTMTCGHGDCKVGIGGSISTFFNIKSKYWLTNFFWRSARTAGVVAMLLAGRVWKLNQICTNWSTNSNPRFFVSKFRKTPPEVRGIPLNLLF